MMSLAEGHTVQTLNDEEVAELSKIAEYFKWGAVKILPENILIPSRYLQFSDVYFTFESRPNDVMVMGYLKTGTTWMQEIIWNMTNNPNLDKSSTPEIYVKSPFLETDSFGKTSRLLTGSEIANQIIKEFPSLVFDEHFKMVDLTKIIPDRRVIKSHLPPTLINPEMLKTAKVIYIIRDPKDVLVSYYHHHRMFKMASFKGNMKEFADAFMDGKVIIGEYPNHIRQWWPYRNHENVLFVHYEDLKMNTMENLKRIDKFIGTNLTEKQLKGIEKATSFEEMKKQATVLNCEEGETDNLFNVDVVKETGGFYRKGNVGSAKKELDADLERTVEEYLRRALKGIPLPYEYLQSPSQ